MRPVPPVPLLAAMLAVVLAISACTSGAIPREVTALPPKATPTPVATPTPTTTPTPTATPTPEPLPVADPFTVTVSEIRMATADNGALYGVVGVAPDAVAANAAVEQAAAVLTRFLNAQFVDPATWFSDAAVATLLHPDSVTPETRQALGVLDARDIEGTISGSATASADVVLAGSTLEAVTLTYASTFDLVLEQATGPVSHAGVLTLVPLQGALTVVGLQPTTTFGGDLPAVLS